MIRRSLLGAAVATLVFATPPPSAPPVGKATSRLRFEANAGQWDPRVRFEARTRGGPLLVTDDDARIGSLVIRLFGGRTGRSLGEGQLAGVSNYYLGRDPSRWRTNVPGYARVRSSGWLPGVDVVWHEGEGGLEFDLEVAEHVDANTLEMSFEGARSLTLTPAGALVVESAEGRLVENPPRVVQGDHEVRGRYVIDGTLVGVALDGYDRDRPVLIDPVVTYATYLGGGRQDYASAIAVDGSGAAYITGYTLSADYPTKSAIQSTYAGWDAIVSKLDPTGSSLVFSTYLGGASYESGNGIAVDGAGNAFVTGFTASTDFPTMSPIQASLAGGNDVFVTKLSATGALVASTYLGGAGNDSAYAATLDGSGNLYIAGSTTSTNYPTKGPAQATEGGGFDAFITKLDGAISSVVYSTYLGGAKDENAAGIAVDGAGNAYVTGSTSSANFPTHNAIKSYNGASKFTGFVSELDAAGSALTYSTYLGGSFADAGSAIVVDSTGAAWVTGTAYSVDFPTANPLQATNDSSYSTVFVSELAPAGTSLAFSTYLGGTGSDMGTAIGIDAAGDVYVAGSTTSTDFPVYNAFQPANAGNGDAFVTKLAPGGTKVAYSTYFGGSTGADGALAIAVDGSGVAYVAGGTSSVDLPTQNPVQSMNRGVEDAFVMRVYDPALALGVPCTPGECASGNCVDGVCCDTACNGQCEACDVTGHIGTCSPVTGLPHGTVRPACGGVVPCEQCDGTHTQSCTLSGTTTACGSTCSSAVETDSFCDGLGHCGTVVAHPCNKLVCEADGGTCKTSCGLDDDCVSGFACADAGCVPGARCLDVHTSQPATGSQQDCTPYACETILGCKTQCSSVNDCAPPNVCDPTGKCVSPSGSSSGCNCDVGTRGTPWWVAMAVIGLGLAGTRRRRWKS